MDNQIRNALEYYRLRVERRLSGKMTVQQYYEELREYIYAELRDTGKCALIEYLFRMGGAEWDLPTYDAVVDALVAVYQGCSMEEPREVKPVVANADTSVIRLDGQRFAAVEAYYNRCVENWQDAPRHWSRDFLGGSSGKSDRQAAKARAEAEKTREQARSDAERIRTNAKAEAERILEQARAEAKRLLDAAATEKSQADVVMEAAQEELLSARQQAGRITDEASAEAERLRQEVLREARDEANALLEEEAEQTLRRMVGGKLNGYLDQQRRFWEAEDVQIRNARENIAQQTALLKEQACSFSNHASAELTRVMEQTMEQMLAVKASFNTQLQQWKADMYRCEYNPIISCFNSLLVLEKRFERDVAAESDMTVEERLTKLQQHSASLSGFRSRLERAMNAMGLSLFVPQPGDRFDACYHTLDDDEDDEQYGDQLIAECTSPGIMRRVNSEEETVMQRAAVTLQPAEEQHTAAMFR